MTIYRGDDNSIVFTGTNADLAGTPTGWALQFSVAKQRGRTPDLIVTTPTITITGTTTYIATVPLTRAQTSLLTLDEYDWDLHRTDSGSVSIKAGGTLQVTAPAYPPVAPV